MRNPENNTQPGNTIPHIEGTKSPKCDDLAKTYANWRREMEPTRLIEGVTKGILSRVHSMKTPFCAKTFFPRILKLTFLHRIPSVSAENLNTQFYTHYEHPDERIIAKDQIIRKLWAIL